VTARWVRTTARLTPVVLAAAGLSIGGLFLSRAVLPLHDLEGSTDAIGNYLQTVGGIYAVLLAFVVYVVWGQFNDARGYVAREATALIDLYRTSGYLPASSRTEVQRGLEAYVRAVIDDEWRALARSDDAVIERVGDQLEAVWDAIHHATPDGDCELAIYGEMITMFNELTDLRTSRLTSARSRIPIAMKILLYTGAVITVASMYFMAFGAVWLQATVTGALAGSIANILFLIQDLDDAFAGDWRVAPRPFERALRMFAKRRGAAA
jgi:hypothetical protein